MRSAEMTEYLERCRRNGFRVNESVLRIIARKTGECTNWIDARYCTNENCANH